MKKLRKLSALLIAAVMVFAMAVPAWAVPTAEDKGQISVSGVEFNATVKAYKVIEPNYATDGGLLDPAYKFVSAVPSNLQFANMEEPTSEEMTALAAWIKNNKDKLDETELTTTGTEGEATFTSPAATEDDALGAGAYVVLITGGSDLNKIYNPSIVSIDYDGNDISDGTVDQNSAFSYGNKAYAKSTEPTFEKGIVSEVEDPSDDAEEGAMIETLIKGDAVQATTKSGENTTKVGDEVKFRIISQIPDYVTSLVTEGNVTDTTIKPITYKISDTLDDYFDDITNIVVKDETGTEVVAGDNTFALTQNGRSFTIEFKEAFLKANATKKVTIDYKSKLNDNILSNNFAENLNEAKLEYTNDVDGGTGEKKDRTYHYTFSLDGILDAEDTPGSDGWTETHELNKVTEGGKTYNVETTTREEWHEAGTKASEAAKEGAKFALYTDEACTAEVGTATSDANGHINFTGLDAGKYYYMKETEAPAGFSKDETVVRIMITADIDEANGTLKGYSVAMEKYVNNAWTAAGEASYKNTPVVGENGKVTNTIVTEKVTPLEIVNLVIPGLPSTGGMGTYIFTILGVALIGVAASLLIFKRRKDA